MTSPLKKRTRYTLPLLQQRILSDELGKYVEKDEALVGSLEREKFVSGRQGDGYFTDGWGVNHLDRRLLCQYLHWGAPVVLLGKYWTEKNC